MPTILHECRPNPERRIDLPVIARSSGVAFDPSVAKRTRDNYSANRFFSCMRIPLGMLR